MAEPVVAVSDLKQFIFCPRIPFFTHVLALSRPVSVKMAEGQKVHLDVERLETRRTLARYGFRGEAGERRFRLALTSSRLGLSGLLDVLLVSPRGLYPVEYKFSDYQPTLSWKYQLTAYALLVEEEFNRPVHAAFVYCTRSEEIWSVPVTVEMRRYTKEALERLRRMLWEERFPPVRRQDQKCQECEWQNYCADGWHRRGERHVFLGGRRATLRDEERLSEGA